MTRHEFTAKFARDYKKLPREHQEMFNTALREFTKNAETGDHYPGLGCPG